MGAKHTPGPWKLYGPRRLRPQFPTMIVEVQDQHGEPIVAWGGFDGVRQSKSERNANARLIAAAPEMMESLKDLLHFVAIWNEAEARDYRGILPAARALLAKIEG